MLEHRSALVAMDPEGSDHGNWLKVQLKSYGRGMTVRATTNFDVGDTAEPHHRRYVSLVGGDDVSDRNILCFATSYDSVE